LAASWGLLAGRADELACFERALDDLDGGRSRAIIIRGEPGIGKSRMLAELAARADARGHIVLTGRGGELEAELPYGLITDALDDYLASLEPSVDAIFSHPEVAVVFPSLAKSSTIDAAVAEHRLRVHRSVRTLLGTLADPRPLVIELDDLHWADLASVHLVGYLLRHPPPGPVLLVGAFRPAQAATALSAALDRAVRENAAESITLRPLSREEAAELLGGVDRATFDRVYEHAGGNPFYLEQLRGRGDQIRTSEAAELAEVPPAVAAALAEELRSLSPDARDVVEAAAVTGDPFETGLVCAVAELSESDLVHALDETLRRDLVRPTEVPRWFRFRHPLVRHAVYFGTGDGWRIGAHARAARVLAATGAPLPVQAAHVERSAPPGDEPAIALLTAAGNEVVRHAPTSAARWFAAALRLVPMSAPDARLAVLAALADALAAAGELEACRAALEDALDLVANLPDARRHIVTLASAVDHMRGRHDQARGIVERELHAMDDQRSAEAGILFLSLAYDGMYRADYDTMQRQAQAAHALVCRGPSKGAEAAALTLLSFAEYALANLAAARHHLHDARTLVDGLGDDRVARRLDTLAMLVMVEYSLEQFDDALRHADRGLALAHSTGQHVQLTLLMVARAITLAFLGRVRDAAEQAETAYEASLLVADDVSRPMAASIASKAWCAAGELALAIRAGERAVERAAGEEGLVPAYAAVYLADALLEAGRAAEAHDVLIGRLGVHLAGVERPSRSRVYEILVRSCLAQGNIDGARQWLDRGESDLLGIDLGLRVAEIARARAALLLAADEPDAAVDAAARAVASADEAGTPLEAARARILLARSLARLGRNDEAITPVACAEETLTRLGAYRYSDEAAQLLRQLGRPRGRRPTSAREHTVLSPREREIAELVAHGRTNRQIATELFVSDKTVETHLARVFRKLGIASRGGVARALDQLSGEPSAQRAGGESTPYGI
jgi:DNA-binding NarL/FixJ family response regulator